MLIFICFLLALLYLGGLGFLFYHWHKIKKPEPKSLPPDSRFVSVVVVVRNEEDHIRELLRDLNKQNFRKNGFEVIIVDDHSTDKTSAILEEVKEAFCFRLRLFSLRGAYGKKAGLEEGIKKAEGELILVTDGDCRVPESWILSVATFFYSKNAAFVSGPVSFSGEKGLFQKMQTIEFASLVGTGAALLKGGRPGMCNAANMAFLKKAYLEAGGYSSNLHIPSGDDEFLLQAIYLLYPQQVFYLKSPLAVVKTGAKQSWKTFYHQRKRWAGKWKLHKKPSVVITAMALFAFYASWVLLFALMWAKGLLLYFFLAALLKFAAECLFLRSVLQSFKKKWLWFPFVVLYVLYPLYVLFFGLAVNFGSFNWKGRAYKYAEL